MNYTNEQLKQALARLLPDTLVIKYKWEYGILAWHNKPNVKVLDTELLYLCWRVEETLNKQLTHNVSERNRYAYYLQTECGELGCVHATWQQRTVALCKVKGVEI